MIMTIIVNLTPHTINLNDGRAFAPSGTVARVATGYSAFDAHGICDAIFGEIADLPDPAPDTLYIVSGMVAAATKGKRPDVVAPATGHPDAHRDAGQIVSVPGFVRS